MGDQNDEGRSGRAVRSVPIVTLQTDFLEWCMSAVSPYDSVTTRLATSWIDAVNVSLRSTVVAFIDARVPSPAAGVVRSLSAAEEKFPIVVFVSDAAEASAFVEAGANSVVRLPDDFSEAAGLVRKVVDYWLGLNRFVLADEIPLFRRTRPSLAGLTSPAEPSPAPDDP